MRITVKQLKRLIKEALSELPPKIDPSTHKPNKSEPVCGLLVDGVARSSYTTLERAKEVAEDLKYAGYDVEIFDFKRAGSSWDDFKVRGADAYLTNRSAKQIIEPHGPPERFRPGGGEAGSSMWRPREAGSEPIISAWPTRSSTGEYIPGSTGYLPKKSRSQYTMGVHEGRYRRNK